MLIKQTPINSPPNITSTFPTPSNFICSQPIPSACPPLEVITILSFVLIKEIRINKHGRHYITNECLPLLGIHLTLLKIFLIVLYGITLEASVIYFEYLTYKDSIFQKSKVLTILNCHSVLLCVRYCTMHHGSIASVVFTMSLWPFYN